MKKKPLIKKYVIGTSIFNQGLDQKFKTCHKCSKDIYFIDKWNWKTTLPICHKCAKKFLNPADVHITKIQKKEIMEQFNLSNEEFEELAEKVKKEIYSRKYIVSKKLIEK